MIDRLKRLLWGDGGAGARRASPQAEAVPLAAAALLVEAALMDGHFDDDERRTIEALLERHFDLEPADATTLIHTATEALDQANELYRFTRVIKDDFGHDDRVRMIEMLWEVAYADGHLHDYEANLVRRVAGLLHVADRDSGTARKRVLRRLEPGVTRAT